MFILLLADKALLKNVQPLIPLTLCVSVLRRSNRPIEEIIKLIIKKNPLLLAGLLALLYGGGSAVKEKALQQRGSH
jgi:hypothetical protein